MFGYDNKIIKYNEYTYVSTRKRCNNYYLTTASGCTIQAEYNCNRHKRPKKIAAMLDAIIWNVT